MSLIHWFLNEISPYKDINYLIEYQRHIKNISESRLQNSSSPSTRLLKKLLIFQLIQFIRFLLIYLLPITNEQRVMIFDISQFYEINNNCNLVSALVTLLSAYFLYQIYFKFPQFVQALFHQIIVKGETKYFLHDKTKVLKQINTTTLNTIKQTQIFTFVLSK